MSLLRHKFQQALAGLAIGAATTAAAWADPLTPVRPAGVLVEVAQSPESPAAAVEPSTPAVTAAAPSPAPAACPPAKPKPPAPKKLQTCYHGHLIDWSKYPATLRPLPRPGIFPIVPVEGPGYFSFWDDLVGNERKAPPKSGYAPFAINAQPFFDSDWRYVDGVPAQDRTIVESLKRIQVGNGAMLSTGGEVWSRYMGEHNSRLTEADNSYNLAHVRMYGDFWYNEGLRVYAEGVWADSFGEDLAPLGIDVDRGDFTDLFVDLKLFEAAGAPVYVRGGRQELLYGSQRLLSPLPWANVRRTFQGVKLFRTGEKWDIDAFWMQPVIPNASQFDAPDENQNLAGTWWTYKPRKGETVDLYYLMLNNSNPVVQQGIVRSPTHNHTFGSRWAGAKNDWLWDFEGMMQTGEVAGNGLFAGAANAGVGRTWKNSWLSPTAWLYYDYASGDHSPNAGTSNTFNQLFPFGHYYLGWMDQVGRQNIHDLNVHAYFYPAPWITVWTQYHHFWLDSPTDALYNAGGVAIRRDPTGAAGRNVGDELNLVVNFHLARYTDVLVSCNKLYGGRFLQQTAGPNAASNAESLYLMFSQRW